MGIIERCFLSFQSSPQTDRPVHTHQFNSSISFSLTSFPYTHTAQFDIFLLSGRFLATVFVFLLKQSHFLISLWQLAFCEGF